MENLTPRDPVDDFGARQLRELEAVDVQASLYDWTPDGRAWVRAALRHDLSRALGGTP